MNNGFYRTRSMRTTMRSPASICPLLLWKEMHSPVIGSGGNSASQLETFHNDVTRSFVCLRAFLASRHFSSSAAWFGSSSSDGFRFPYRSPTAPFETAQNKFGLEPGAQSSYGSFLNVSKYYGRNQFKAA